jgi:hypothetical protein
MMEGSGSGSVQIMMDPEGPKTYASGSTTPYRVDIVPSHNTRMTFIFVHSQARKKPKKKIWMKNKVDGNMNRLSVNSPSPPVITAVNFPVEQHQTATTIDPAGDRDGVQKFSKVPDTEEKEEEEEGQNRGMKHSNNRTARKKADSSVAAVGRRTNY